LVDTMNSSVRSRQRAAVSDQQSAISPWDSVVILFTGHSRAGL
jgi:hypothetical protein